MKKIFLLLFVCACANVYAQNGDVPKLSSIIFSDPIFKKEISKFPVGFQWGHDRAPKEFINYFGVTIAHIVPYGIGCPIPNDPNGRNHYAELYYGSLPDTCPVILGVAPDHCGNAWWGIGGQDKGLHAAQSAMAEYDPVADVSNPLHFVADSTDTTGAVFGFQKLL